MPNGISMGRILSKLPIILVVDDEKQSQDALRRVLADDFRVLTASSAEEAETVLTHEMVHAILCDQRMPGMQGVDFLRQARERWPETVRMIISGYTDADDIITGINEAGIYQYITKPWNPDVLVATVKEALHLWELQQASATASLDLKVAPGMVEKAVAKKTGQLKKAHHFDRIAHAHASPLSEAIDLARKASAFDISVLITGESGTGKELMARFIHNKSPRAKNRFVAVNCAAIPENLLESELFGHEKGAFTGAVARRIGKFEEATGGTLLLDEISEMDIRLQAKLLRAIQEKEIDRVGGNNPVKIDVRIVATSNRNLEDYVRQGGFREDLYYRLNVVNLALPALRERPLDISLLADHFAKKYAAINAVPVRVISAEARQMLIRHIWRGNVRELENTIHRAVLLATGPDIGADAIILSGGQVGGPQDPVVAQAATAAAAVISGATKSGLVGKTVAEVERDLIIDTLGHCLGNRTHAANILGISIRTLRNKLKQYSEEGLSVPPPQGGEERMPL